MGLFDSLQPEQNRRDDVPERTMADVLALPDETRTIVTWLVRRREVGLSEVAALLEQDEATAQTLLTDLVEQGFVQEVLNEGEEQPRYRVRLAARRGRQVPLDL
jgi:DNA-binding IclR family transcriptional regulator